MSAVDDPITEAELKKIDCDEEFAFGKATHEERLIRLRELQRIIASTNIRISTIQRLEMRAYELASAEEREKLRQDSASYKPATDTNSTREELNEEEKLIQQFISMGRTREWAEEYLKKMGLV